MININNIKEGDKVKVTIGLGKTYTGRVVGLFSDHIELSVRTYYHTERISTQYGNIVDWSNGTQDGS